MVEPEPQDSQTQTEQNLQKLHVQSDSDQNKTVRLEALGLTTNLNRNQSPSEQEYHWTSMKQLYIDGVYDVVGIPRDNRKTTKNQTIDDQLEEALDIARDYVPKAIQEIIEHGRQTKFVPLVDYKTGEAFDLQSPSLRLLRVIATQQGKNWISEIDWNKQIEERDQWKEKAQSSEVFEPVNAVYEHLRSNISRLWSNDGTTMRSGRLEIKSPLTELKSEVELYKVKYCQSLKPLFEGSGVDFKIHYQAIQASIDDLPKLISQAVSQLRMKGEYCPEFDPETEKPFEEGSLEQLKRMHEMRSGNRLSSVQMSRQVELQLRKYLDREMKKTTYSTDSSKVVAQLEKPLHYAETFTIQDEIQRIHSMLDNTTARRRQKRITTEQYKQKMRYVMHGYSEFASFITPHLLHNADITHDEANAIYRQFKNLYSLPAEIDELFEKSWNTFQENKQRVQESGSDLLKKHNELKEMFISPATKLQELVTVVDNVAVVDTQADKKPVPLEPKPDVRSKSRLLLVQNVLGKRISEAERKISLRLESLVDKKAFLTHIGLDPQEILRVWKSSSFEPRELIDLIMMPTAAMHGTLGPEIIQRNLDSAVSLEAARPGSVKELHDRFGITNFCRYPLEALVHQYDMRDSDLPYGVMAFAHSDWNGAFYQDEQLLRQFTDKTRKFGYTSRIIEVGSKKDLLKRILQLNSQYGEHHKISFGIIGGHGNENSIALGIGKNDKEYDITSDDFKKPWLKTLINSFYDSAELALISCSTGAREGIADSLSRLVGLKVYAPRKPSTITVMNPTVDDNKKLHLNAEFSAVPIMLPGNIALQLSNISTERDFGRRRNPVRQTA